MEDILNSIKEARERAKKRKFVQTWDFLINVKGIDLKKPENRFTQEIALPHGTGKDVKIAVIADTLVSEARKHAQLVITKDEIEKFDKKELKKLAEEYDWFFAEAPLMTIIAKTFGPVFGPRGKMPKPVPPNAKLEPLINAVKKMIRITLKDTPVIYAVVGKETMPDEEVAANVQTVLNFVKEKLPKGRTNIKSAYIKLTMGPPVKIKVI